jgi:hypothetical protein
MGDAAKVLSQDPNGDPLANPATAGKTLTDPEFQRQLDALMGLTAGSPNDITPLMDKYKSGLRGTEFGNVDNDTVRGDRNYNANGMSAARTLRLSRLADKLNNRIYRKPSIAGNLGVTTGGGVTGSVGEIGMPYQMPKIETEEMRQMGHIREAAASRQEQDEARRQEIMGEQWRTNRIAFLENLARNRTITEVQMKELEHLRYEEIRMKYSEPYNRYWRVTEEELRDWRLKWRIPEAVANFLRPMLNQGRFIEATILGSAFGLAGVPPSLTQILGQQLTKPVLSLINQHASLEDIVEYVKTESAPFIDMAKDAIPGNNKEAGN